MRRSVVRGLLCGLLLLVPVVAMAQDMPDLFPEVGPDGTPIDPNQITDEFWSTGVFTEAMRLFDNALTESRWPLFEAALSLLHWLAVLEVAFVFIAVGFGASGRGGAGVDPNSLLGRMCGILILIGFMVEIISQFPYYTQIWSDGCVWVGLQIGGTAASLLGSTPMTIEEFKDVGLVMLRGLTKLNQPYDYLFSMSSLSWGAFLKASVIWAPMMVALVVAAVCFLAIGVIVLLAWFELWVVSAVAIPFLAWIVLHQTRGLGLSMLSSVVSAGVRLGTLAAIVGVMDGVIARINMIDPQNITVGTCFALLVLAFAFLCMAGLIPVKLARLVGGQGMFGSGLSSLSRML
jgi:type IV secretion system protein TrbL